IPRRLAIEFMKDSLSAASPRGVATVSPARSVDSAVATIAGLAAAASSRSGALVGDVIGRSCAKTRYLAPWSMLGLQAPLLLVAASDIRSPTSRFNRSLTRIVTLVQPESMGFTATISPTRTTSDLE